MNLKVKVWGRAALLSSLRLVSAILILLVHPLAKPSLAVLPRPRPAALIWGEGRGHLKPEWSKWWHKHKHITLRAQNIISRGRKYKFEMRGAIINRS